MSAKIHIAEYFMAALAGAAVAVLAINGVTSLQAAPSDTPAVVQSNAITPGGMVDRSRKGNRLDFVAPATRQGMPAGCDSPLSSLAKPLPSDIAGRCLT
jgi:hypothetical protein